MSRLRDISGVFSTPLGARLVLLLVTLALTLLGVVMVYSAGSIEALSDGTDPTSYLVRHLVFALVGAAAAAVVWKCVPYSAWRGSLMWALWLLSVFLLVLTAFMGTEEGGAQRWLVLGSISFQPSELAKIALIMMTAHQFALYREGQAAWQAVAIRIFVFVLIPALVMFLTQSDLGTTAIMVMGVLAIMWLSDISPKIMLIAIVGLIGFGLLAIFGSDYRADRFAYLDPWNDGEGGYGNGYQIIRSYFSIADGGIFGLGLGNSRGKYSYLPEAETDFIFAVVAEELGMIGGIVVILLFVALLFAGIAIAQQSRDSYGAMLAGSLTVMIVFQAFLNIACVVGILPTTGKPLPFISSGGSSLIVSLIMVGLILSVSEGSATADVYERRRANLRLVRNDTSRHVYRARP